MSQSTSVKKSEAVHYRYRLNEEKAKAFYKLESLNGFQTSINGFILSSEYWSIPRLQKIDFRIFANIKGSTETGIIDEELYVPASRKCISKNGVKYEKDITHEVEDIYSYERLLSFTHEELKQLAEDSYDIKGNFQTAKLREEIIKAQNKVVPKIKEVEIIKPVEEPKKESSTETNSTKSVIKKPVAKEEVSKG